MTYKITKHKTCKMKKRISILLLIISTTIQITKAQVIMPDKEVTQIFTAAVKSQFNLQYPIFRVYKYIDKAGQFYTDRKSVV